MGKRTIFYQSSKDESFKNQLTEDYSSLRKWLLKTNEASVRDYNERTTSTALEGFLIENESLLRLHEIDQVIVDELAILYLLDYCDFGNPGHVKFEIVGPMVATKKYDKLRDAFIKSKDGVLSRLGGYLKFGRSIKADEPFTAQIDDLKLAFWSFEERVAFQDKLCQSGSKPKSTDGYELLMSLFEEVASNSKEILVCIE